MLKTELIFCFLALGSLAGAQETATYVPLPEMRYPEYLVAVDTCRLSVVYDFVFRNDTIDLRPLHDRYALEIGRRIARFHSLYADRCDSIAYRDRQRRSSDERLTPTRAWMKKDEQANYEDVYTNHPEPGWLHVCMELAKESYSYEEPRPQPEWRIVQGDTARILGYVCMKATAELRGRTWTAWFAPDIPAAFGPWKLGGLPGLILRAEEDDGLFAYEAVGISATDAAPIYVYDVKKAGIRRSDRKNVRRLMRLRWQDPAMLTRSQGVRILAYTPQTGLCEVQAGSLQYRYIPELELE